MANCFAPASPLNLGTRVSSHKKQMSQSPTNEFVCMYLLRNVPCGERGLNTGNGIEGTMVCTSLASLLRPLFYFLCSILLIHRVQRQLFARNGTDPAICGGSVRPSRRKSQIFRRKTSFSSFRRSPSIFGAAPRSSVCLRELR